MLEKKAYKLGYFVSHPIQYQTPLLRQISEHDDIDLCVFFLCDLSVNAFIDPEFKVSIKWDIPLLKGYKYKFLNSKLKTSKLSFSNPKVPFSEIRKVLRENDLDAVLMHGYGNFALIYLLILSNLKNIPVLLSGDSNLFSTKKGFIRSLFVKFIIRSCAGLLFNGSDNRDYYLHYGAKPEQLFFSPYSVNNSFFQSYLRNHTPNSKCTFLFAGKMTERKNAVLLLTAFLKLETELQEQSELWFIGNGEQYSKLEALIQKYNLEDKVNLLGFKNQKELPNYLSRCDVFVIPSEREPFGLIVNEAMNLAKPILATDQVAAATDLVEHGINGWVVKAGCVDSLAVGLKTAIQSKDKLNEMGTKSLEKINNWGYEQQVDGIISALKAHC